jgi:hypothetical protein
MDLYLCFASSQALFIDQTFGGKYKGHESV